MATIDEGGITTLLEKVDPGGRSYVSRVSILEAYDSPWVVKM